MLSSLVLPLFVQSVLSADVAPSNECSSIRESLDEQSVYNREVDKWVQKFVLTVSKQPPNASEIYHLLTMGVTYNYVEKFDIKHLENHIIHAINILLFDPITARKMHRYKIPWLKLITFSRSANIVNLLRPIAEASKSRLPSHLIPREFTQTQKSARAIMTELLAVQQELKCANQSDQIHQCVLNVAFQCQQFLEATIDQRISEMELQSIVTIFGLIMDIQLIHHNIYNHCFLEPMKMMVGCMAKITANNLQFATKTYQIMDRKFRHFKDYFKSQREDLLSKGFMIQAGVAEYLIFDLGKLQDNCNIAQAKGTLSHLLGQVEHTFRNANDRQLSVFEFDNLCDLFQTTLETLETLEISASIDINVRKEYILRILKHTMDFIYATNPSEVGTLYIMLLNTYPQYIQDYNRMLEQLEPRNFTNMCNYRL